MDAKDRNFLARADTVTANYQHRIIELERGKTVMACVGADS